MNIRVIKSILLAVVVSVGLIAVACGSGSEETPVETSTPETGGAAAGPTETPVETPTETPSETPAEAPTTSAITTDDTPVPGSTDGAFVIGSGSEATFTVNEQLSRLPLPNDAVLRTSDVTGDIDLSAATANITIDLHTLESDESRRDRYVRERLFPRQREATIRVGVFPDIPEEFAEGKAFTSTVIATVNVNGVDAEIEFEIESRLDPDRLLVLVKGDFTWADFGMSAPTSNFFVVKNDVHVEVLISAVPG